VTIRAIELAIAELRPALTGRGLIAADDRDYRTSRAKSSPAAMRAAASR
jgi:hypothetical protein